MRSNVMFLSKPVSFEVAFINMDISDCFVAVDES